MKFTCEKALLSAAINVTSRTVALKSTIPALEGIQLNAGMKLTLSGYNLETGISVDVPAEIRETGVCVMPARLFGEIIRKLPDETLTVTVDEALKVSIRCGISSFNITAMSADEYPALPDVEYANNVSLAQSALKAMLSGTMFSVSENQARPIQTGCLFEVENNTISVIAVDGYRLALRRTYFEESLERTMKFVVPASGLKEVEKILEDSDAKVSFTLGTKHILFEIGEVTLVCRLLEGEFLDWRRVVPTENPISLAANVRGLTASVERVGLIISEKIKSPVRCLFGKNEASFTTSNTIGAAQDACAIAGDGEQLEIGFNCRYLLEALRAVPTEEVSLGLTNSLSPLVLTPCSEQQTYLYMVLPVRIKTNEN